MFVIVCILLAIIYFGFKFSKAQKEQERQNEIARQERLNRPEDVCVIHTG